MGCKLLLVGGSADEVASIARVIAAGGWSQQIARSSSLEQLIDVNAVVNILVDAEQAQVFRCRNATTPVIAVAPASFDWQAHDYDAFVDRSRIAEDLSRVLADWSHIERLKTLARLRDMFGAAAMAALAKGLRHTIESALAARDDAALADVAHRLAGLAGTLGFAALGRQWLRVAEGERPITDRTRRASAHALATLAQAEDNGVFTDF